MKITNLKDVKVGHWITFVSVCKEFDKFGNLIDNIPTRKFYEIISIEKDEYQCKTYIPNLSNKRPEQFYDTVITNLFYHKNDEVFETFEDLKFHYAGEFI